MSTKRPESITFAFLDLETTGLDPRRHEIWEVGLVVERLTFWEGSHQDVPWTVETLHESCHFLPVKDLGAADAKALEIGGYYTRHPYAVGQGGVADQGLLAHKLAPLFAGTHLVGCTIHFDAAFLEKFLRDHGQAPVWDYHLIDATVYAAGRAGLRPPWKSKVIKDHYAKHFGVTFPEGRAHHALDDAKMSRDLYYAALDLGPV